MKNTRKRIQKSTKNQKLNEEKNVKKKKLKTKEKKITSFFIKENLKNSMSVPAEFSHGLFSCMGDMGVCLQGCFCTPCLMCKNQALVEGDSCGLKQCCFPMLEFNTRQFIRRRKHMQEECCYDCCVFWCCAPCFICQDARELKEGFGLAPANEGYFGKTPVAEKPNSEQKAEYYVPQQQANPQNQGYLQPSSNYQEGVHYPNQ